MKFSAILGTIAMLASGAVARLGSQLCSATSALPCLCPNGTDYTESITTIVIGANAKDVAGLINDFFNTSWLGELPWKTEGKNNVVGAVRTTEFPTSIGLYNFTEKLIEYEVKPDGAFIQRYEQLKSTIPLAYQHGNGSFSGLWVTLEAKPVFEHETIVVWHNYACETGHVRNFAKSHENALRNTTRILDAEGKILGVSSEPYSVQDF
ncbi:hypothetical protein VTJ04DRAFT_2861 [Mycothermus thermophilus]|uniref:uncharacterized protein n=1 Tax=Humicola insolens TaxID=85995 RepID=UPI0037433D08